FGTLGWRPQSLLPSIRSTSHLDRVAFYHSDHAKSRDARAKVVEFCRGLGGPCTAVEVSDAYDLLQVAGQLRADVRKETSAEKADSETAMAGGLGVHKATMNHQLGKLASMGTIERQADPADGRRLVIVPAPGIELLLG